MTPHLYSSSHFCCAFALHWLLGSLTLVAECVVHLGTMEDWALKMFCQQLFLEREGLLTLTLSQCLFSQHCFMWAHHALLSCICCCTQILPHWVRCCATVHCTLLGLSCRCFKLQLLKERTLLLTAFPPVVTTTFFSLLLCNPVQQLMSYVAFLTFHPMPVPLDWSVQAAGRIRALRIDGRSKPRDKAGVIHWAIKQLVACILLCRTCYLWFVVFHSWHACSSVLLHTQTDQYFLSLHTFRNSM